MSPLTIVLILLLAGVGFTACRFYSRAEELSLQCANLEKGLAAAQDEVKRFRTRYAPVIDLDAELARVKEALEQTRREQQEASSSADRQRIQLKEEYERARATYDSLKREISLLEENLEDISFGLYKPHFSFQSSEAYKATLEALRDKERQLIRDGKAATCSVQ
jgi:chromosome segregation ATPase